MLDEILRNIWDGGTGLDLTKQQSVREKEIIHELGCCDELLEERLKKSDWDLLEKYRNLNLSLRAECEYQSFKIGYRFGIRMIMDGMYLS